MVANFYKKEFRKISSVKIPICQRHVYHAYHLFTILIDFEKLKMSRNSFMKKLANKGIGSQVLYIPVFMQPYYQKNINLDLMILQIQFHIMKKP